MSIREDICQAMMDLSDSGLNRGTTGNVSVRDGESLLISPSGIPSADISPDMVARLPVSGDGEWEGPCAPSVEWRFHRDILLARPDVQAVVHTHAPFSTILADARRPIPAIHYMIAAFGGAEIRVCDYARYGTAELSTHVVTALEGRAGCLMANHGMVVVGENLGKAMWLAEELEALAHQYWHVLAIGGGHLLSDAEIEETAEGFTTYGPQNSGANA